MPNQSTKIKALIGSVWTLGGYGISQILRLFSHLVLAWLLTPEIFGLMALVKVVQHGIEMFSDVGIKPSIVQHENGADPVFLNTAWSIQVIRGFMLWACFCILAWPIAAWFARSDPAAWQLKYLLPVAGFMAVLQGFNSTALATLNRKLQLGRVTLLELGTQIVSLLVMVGWALICPSVWSMVAGGLAGAVFMLVVSHFIVPGARVRFAWDKQAVQELFKFGRWIFLSTLFTFLALNLDKLVLGKLLTLEDLGLYSIAFVFAKVALHVVTRLGNSVLFPVYSTYRDDPLRMVVVALKAREIVLWVGAGVCLCFAVGAPLFFETLWDQRYHEAGKIAQWLSLYIWSMIILLTMDRIPLALGNSKILFFANIWRCLGILGAIAGYNWYGLFGFIMGLACGPMIAHMVILQKIPVKRKEFTIQGVIFTFPVLLYGVGATVLTTVAWRDVWLVAILAIAPLILSAVIAYKRIRGEFAK